MTARLSTSAVWQASVDDKSARVELWLHPLGWECRAFSHGRLLRRSVFADVRDAHLEATNWLSALASDDVGGPSGGLK